MKDKLQIYYQPAQPNAEAFKSLTISYYEFDEQHRTFKQKIILEKAGEKYKIKRWIGQLGSIKPFLEELDLSNYKSSSVQSDEAYFYIKYGDQTLSTSNREDIKELLKWIRFDEILSYDLSEYKKCD
jgi:hypothetical protein